MARTAVTSQDQPAASVRPKRTPLANRNRLSVKNKEDGYVYRIVNDVDDRVERLMEVGYELAPKEFVGAHGDKRVDDPSSLGSVKHFSVGQGMKAVVMRQRAEDYKEDQDAKQAEVKALEDTMREAKKVADYGSLELSR